MDKEIIQPIELKELKSLLNKKVKDFGITSIGSEFVVIFQDNTALWFHERPYAIGSVDERKKNES